MKPMQSAFRPYIFLAVFITLFLLSLPVVFAQGAGKTITAEEGAFVNEEERYSIVPPKGFAPLTQEEIRQLVIESRKQFDLPEVEGSQPLDQQIFQMIFKPPGFDPANRSLVVRPKAPPCKLLEEFEKFVTPDVSDPVTLSRETIKVNMRPCFVLDREIDRMGRRFRQLCCYVPDFMQQGFLIIYSADKMEFDEYHENFINSLKTFRVYPPEMSPEMKKSRYTGGKRKKQALTWRSLEVIGSLLFVAVVVIWFLVKQLSAGALEEEAELPGSEGSEGGVPPAGGEGK